MWNRSFAKIYPMFALKEINKMEAEFLIRLDFGMTINATQYTEYYFALIDEAGSAPETSESRTPLDKATAEKLEVHRSPQGLSVCSLADHSTMQILSVKCESAVKKQRTPVLQRGGSMKLEKKVSVSSRTIPVPEIFENPSPF